MIRLPTMMIAFGLLVSGCVSVLPDSGDLPPRIALDAGSPRVGSVQPLPATLVIGDPTSEALLNSHSVAISTAPLEYQYLEDADWTDRVPVLVRRFLVKRFRNSGAYQAVGDRKDIAHGDYVIQPDIEAFHLDRSSGEEVARVTINVLLTDRHGAVLGMKRFSSDVPTATRSRQGRARALNDAAATVGSDIETWVSEKIAAQSNSGTS